MDKVTSETEQASCWAEQNAVWKWMEKYDIKLSFEQERDLKESVTTYRLELQAQIQELVEEREELQKLVIKRNETLIDKNNELLELKQRLEGLPSEEEIEKIIRENNVSFGMHVYGDRERKEIRENVHVDIKDLIQAITKRLKGEK